MLGNSEDAAEAVQQTFLSAYRDLTSSGKAIALKAWLFTIARNRCLSMLRARREHADVDVVEPATEGLAAEVERREDLRELLGDLSRLPEDQRAALVLAEIGSLAHEEIADVVGCSREKVKALVFQARSSLAVSREARATSCEDIREQLSSLRGGALRRTGLRRHLRDCPGCQAFSEEVRRQRQAFAVILPVAPVAGLKEAVLSGVGIGGGGAAAATTGAGGAAAGLGAWGAKGLAVKALVGAAIVSGGTAGGIAVTGLAEGGGKESHGPGATPAASARAAGGRTSSVAAQGVAAAASTAVQLSASSASRADSPGARAGTPGQGKGSKPGQNHTQPGRGSSPSRVGAGHGPKNAGNGPSGKSPKAPKGNAYAPAKAPKAPATQAQPAPPANPSPREQRRRRTD